MTDVFLGDYYEDDPVIYGNDREDNYDEEPSFSDVPEDDWNLCENCDNYLPCGRCLLDMREVDGDEPCSFNEKKEEDHE